MTKVLIFGVFDLFHAGHVHFIDQALTHGDSLTIVVTRDEMVRSLKNHEPMMSEGARLAGLKKFYPSAEVILGDAAPRTWRVLRQHRPDVIACGYDQAHLKRALAMHIQKNNLAIRMIDCVPYEPEIYHTSLLL